jgi:DNA-binding response OmpR family regulator
MVKEILIIDDEEDIREVLKAVLEMQGYKVMLASNGLDGIDKFRKSMDSLSLVLLDVMLPDINGFQIIQIIRKESSVPVIMLTAKDRNTDKILGLELGADDYVVKPFDTLELLARIKAVLRRYEVVDEKKPANLQFNLSIDEENRTITLKDKKVQLTHTEFEIFKYLLSKANEIVTRKELKEALWKDKELYQWSRTIDVHISHIREKIEEDPENPKLLITIPQKGYKLRV